MSRRSGDLGLLMTLGGTYPIQQEDGANERLRWFQAAVAAAPANAAAHNNLGIALKDKGQLDEAIACYKKAIELDPKFASRPHQPGHCADGQGPVGRGHRLLQEGHRTRPEASPSPTTTWAMR